MSPSVYGVVYFYSNFFEDARGELWSSFLGSYINKTVNTVLNFSHDKFAFNKSAGTLRGIHGDFESWKLVSVPHGSAFQVYVDNRPDSETFKKFGSINLCSKEKLSILLPPGVGNGFQTLEQNTLYFYKLCYPVSYNDYDKQFTLKWDDPELGIKWPLQTKILSKRDA